MDDKPLVFIDREGKPGGGKGLLVSKDKTFTLSGLRQNLLVWEETDGSGNDRQCDTECGHESHADTPLR